MNVEQANKANLDTCNGCGLCSIYCPTKAITLVSDARGFLSPKISNKCINCNKCVEICPLKREFNLNSNEKYLIAKNKNEFEKVFSQSGGISFVIAKKVLEQKGVFYGAVFENGKTITKRCVSSDDIKKTRGSKYTWSDFSGSLTEVLNDLKEKRFVCFSGTPCQTHAVKCLAEKENLLDNLLLVDLICHGTTSPNFLTSYLNDKEKKEGKISNFIFRNRIFGYGTHSETLFSKKRTFSTNEFKLFYYSKLGFRENCFSCKFTTLKRGSDITIGDAWNIADSFPEFKSDELGISLVITHNEKGEKFIDMIKNNINFINIDLNNYKLQDALINPVTKPPNYAKFVEKIKASKITDLWKIYQKTSK